MYTYDKVKSAKDGKLVKRSSISKVCIEKTTIAPIEAGTVKLILNMVM